MPPGCSLGFQGGLACRKQLRWAAIALMLPARCSLLPPWPRAARTAAGRGGTASRSGSGAALPGGRRAAAALEAKLTACWQQPACEHEHVPTSLPPHHPCLPAHPPRSAPAGACFASTQNSQTLVPPWQRPFGKRAFRQRQSRSGAASVTRATVTVHGCGRSGAGLHG